jgi:UDP-N-acetylglucosamine 2-epimerase (non-hydrolysing)
MRILHVVGARPNFMKVAPVHRALAGRGSEQLLVHTGQHYDQKMSQVFFEELDLPEPDVNLGVGSGSHAQVTGEVMKRIEPAMQSYEPEFVLVYGDVNSTVAAALVAAKLDLKVGHVEAGLRSFDRTMPEEINRVVTDHVCDILLTPSRDADENLRREGIPAERIHFVGNVMIDTLVRLLPAARGRPVLRELALQDGDDEPTPYVLVTLHRPSNVDDPERLVRIMAVLERLARELTVVFPVHPRTREQLLRTGRQPECPRLRLLEPVGYLDFLHLQWRARAVVTDSGGVQEETTWLGVPCFTLRPNTERPITITSGTNRLVNEELDRLDALVANAVARSDRPCQPPEFWDGRAAERIADVLAERRG